jgi:hypothetical protein
MNAIALHCTARACVRACVHDCVRACVRAFKKGWFKNAVFKTISVSSQALVSLRERLQAAARQTHLRRGRVEDRGDSSGVGSAKSSDRRLNGHLVLADHHLGRLDDPIGRGHVGGCEQVVGSKNHNDRVLSVGAHLDHTHVATTSMCVCVCAFLSRARATTSTRVYRLVLKRGAWLLKECYSGPSVLGEMWQATLSPARFQVLNDRYETLVGSVTAVRLSRTDTTHDLSREAEKRCQEGVLHNEIHRSRKRSTCGFKKASGGRGAQRFACGGMCEHGRHARQVDGG